MRKENLLKVKYRKKKPSLIKRLYGYVFGVDVSGFKDGYFHTLSGYSGRQMTTRQYDIAIIEEANGQVIEIPNNDEYWYKLETFKDGVIVVEPRYIKSLGC